MADANQIGASVVQPGEGDSVAIPGFGAVFKLSGKNNNGEVSIVEPVRGRLHLRCAPPHPRGRALHSAGW